MTVDIKICYTIQQPCSGAENPRKLSLFFLAIEKPYLEISFTVCFDCIYVNLRQNFNILLWCLRPYDSYMKIDILTKDSHIVLSSIKPTIASMLT